MLENIGAIFLDTGNTLRIKVEDAIWQERARRQFASLSGTQEAPEVFLQRVKDRYRAYKKLSKGTLLQISEIELWTRWLLPDYPGERIIPVISQLTQCFHDHDGRVMARPEAQRTVVELTRRGYQLGIIANALSETEIPNWLEVEGLAPYFKTVVLSSRFGRRKPDPYIFLEAAYQLGCPPENCAYVGDNPNRDIQGARQAGFGVVIILVEPVTLKKEPAETQYHPQVTISSLEDLLHLFPPL